MTATVTNLTYYDADGNVLFDQNEYYLPLGEAPEVTSVTAVGDDSREYITVSWTGESVYGDGKYVLQVSKDGGDYTDVADDLTEMSYSYPVTEAGTYTFRVCGTLGNSTEQAAANRNTYVTGNEVEIIAALTAPEVSVDYLSATSGVELSWSESDGAEYYVVYRRSSDETEAPRSQQSRIHLTRIRISRRRYLIITVCRASRRSTTVICPMRRGRFLPMDIPETMYTRMENSILQKNPMTLSTVTTSMWKVLPLRRNRDGICQRNRAGE